MVQNRTHWQPLAICLFIFFLSGTIGIYAQSSRGDANGDGDVTIVDALIIARYYVGNTDEIDLDQSDVNCDGAVNIVDALRVAQYYVGLLSGLVCEEPTPGPLPLYVPGEIIVGFLDEVTLEEADELVASFDLEWEQHFPESFSIWLEVDGDPDYYSELLESYSIVAWAELRGYSGGESGKTYIIAHITGTEAEAEALIGSIEALLIVEYVVANKWGLVDVPVGEESEWIAVFSEQPGIKYATLNHIATIDPL
ncbi:MAG: dockerin type I repeat-containing protein [Spirochaetales bacterium]|nr:dockerin type I repeat-containing protein [Spirochaetales bacterium]